MIMLYRLAAVTLTCSLLISCNDESAFSDFTSTTTTTTTSGGGGSDDGGGGATTTTDTTTTPISRLIILNTDIPLEIPDGAGGMMTAVFQNYSMGNSDASISYVLSTSDSVERIFTPTLTGVDVEIYSRPGEIVKMVTSGDGTKILNYNGRRDIIDYATGTTLAIGTALTFENPSTITDTGDVVALTSRKDLTGANPTGSRQLFTLSTDGSEIYNQITNFNQTYPIENVIISGDGSRIIFTSTADIIGDGSNADGSTELFAINTDGTGLIQLTDFDAFLRPTHLSSDSNVMTMIIRDLNGASGEYLYTLNTTTSAFNEITVVPSGYLIHHDLSADGSKAAYIGENDFGTPSIFLVNSDGSSELNVLTVSGTLEYLNINSDGTSITFYSNEDFTSSLTNENNARQVYTLTPIF
jgi:hypothetical protein